MKQVSYMIKKSPSGSYCPYFYKGGELQPLHYGSYHGNHEKLFAVMDAEQDFILQSHGNRRVWIDLYETKKCAVVYDKLCTHLHAVSHKIAKLALVGCSRLDRYQIGKRMKAIGCPLPISYYDDPEKAKDWLVGKA